ncbi:MAG: hypothetical protein FD165_1968 [Gammaproteobacteria bacterium]|nr:MAG: hypothetical protein FD165_1968 [Gammaproteobacteria bacterium]TND04962.1 MAG: hypothetical protein FD120_1240 [Gammaproteobacteria bacterium]
MKPVAERVISQKASNNDDLAEYTGADRSAGDITNSNHEEEYAVTIKRNSYTISYYPNRIVLKGMRQDIQDEASRILGKFSYSAQPYRIQSETTDSIVIVPRSTSVRL